MEILGWRYWIVKRLWKICPKHQNLPKQLLQLFDQSIYLKIVSYINPNFPNIPTMVQNFQTLFENFALVNMSKLVISKPNTSKTGISYLLKRTLMCTFQEVTNFIFKVDWFTFIKRIHWTLKHRRNICKKWVKTIK